MRVGGGLVTVGVVSGNSLAEGPPAPQPAALSERPWLAPVVLAAGMVLAVLVLAVLPGPHDRGQPAILVILMVCAPIVLLRHWPLPALAVAAVATGLAVASGRAPLPLGIMIGLALYFAASRLPRRVSIRVAV